MIGSSTAPVLSMDRMAVRLVKDSELLSAQVFLTW